MVGGALKMKGGLPGKKTKKKKSKKRRRAEREKLDLRSERDSGDDGTATGGAGRAAQDGADDAEPALGSGPGPDDALTETEQKHKRRLKERVQDEVRRHGRMTHRERVEEMNYKLSTLTEHNDIPRVSAAGNG